MIKENHLKKIAVDVGVATSTVSDWKKPRKEIGDFCCKIICKDMLKGRGTVKKAKNVTLRALKNVNHKTLLVVYRSQKSGWTVFCLKIGFLLTFFLK